MSKYCSSSTLVVILFAVGCALPGCQFGPNALKTGQSQYSDALRVATSEQMLVNLVRMRYRDLPVFLGVTSIATQFQFDQSSEVAGTLNENVGSVEGLNPNALRLSGRVGYAEKPTITYAYLGGEAFLRRMLMPIAVENISLLAESGWRADRVFRLMIEAINGLKNAPTASGPTPSSTPEFESFVEAMRLINELRASGAIEVSFVPRRVNVSLEVPREKVSSGDLISAANSGVSFVEGDDGASASLAVTRRVLVFRFVSSVQNSQRAKRLRGLLGLDANQTEFEIVDAVENAKAGLSGHNKIGLDTRSLMGVLYFLSQSVEVPEEHVERGLVTQTRSEDGHPFDWSEVLGGLFRVYSSTFKPSMAAVSVKHRGRWFYIKDDDESTKSTFSLLGQLFMLQTGEVNKSDPVLTLPVGG